MRPMTERERGNAVQKAIQSVTGDDAQYLMIEKVPQGGGRFAVRVICNCDEMADGVVMVLTFLGSLSIPRETIMQIIRDMPQADIKKF